MGNARFSAARHDRQDAGAPPSPRARSKCRIASSNLSRQPVLQNPTTWPSNSMSESGCTGLPDQGHVSLMQSAMSRAGIFPPVASWLADRVLTDDPDEVKAETLLA